MKAEYINPVLIASEKIIKTVLRLEITLGQLSLLEEHNLKESLAIVIWVTGDFHGRIMFGISKKVACNIASIMMGSTVDKLDDFSKSAVGELANMILGRTGIIFSNRGIEVNISPPTLIEGDKLTISPINSSKNKKTIINVPINLNNGDIIDMKIEIKRNK